MPSVMRWHGGDRLTAFTLVAALLTALSAYLAPNLTWIPWACVLGACAVLITQRVTNEPLLTRIVLSSFCLRIVLAVILYVISSQHLPIFPSFQRDYGAWEFSGDGVHYHYHALKVLDAWRSGIDLPSAFMSGDVLYDVYKGLSLPMAMVYGILGPSPLHFIFVNAWLGAICGLLGYLLASRLGDRRSALIAGGLIAFWPSSILWSTQLLKDSFTLALILAALLSIVVLWQRYSSTGAARTRDAFVQLTCWAALAGSVYGLAFFRNYLGALLTMAVGLVMAMAFGRALLRRRPGEALAAAGIVMVVAAAAVISISTDLYELLSPRNPEIAHVRRGDALRHEGQVQAALSNYKRAVQLNPTYVPGVRALAMTLAQKGEDDAALDTVRAYLELEKDPQQRAAISSIAADISRRATGERKVGPLSAETAGRALPEGSYGSVAGFLKRWGVAVQRPLAWFSARNLTDLRRAQVAMGGGSVIDRTLAFETLWDVIAYLPRALANAYLAPFPWQWAFTGGASGIMRPISGFEIVLIALLIPAMLAGCWHRLVRFRPEEWVVMAFIAMMATGAGIMMANAGTLFRLRLQFLFPSLILASTALPAFAYRFFDTFSQRYVRIPRATSRWASPPGAPDDLAR
jgi:tetratricopeptide (TPR) repeat protein